MGAENETAVTEFILEGFSGLDQRLQLFLSLLLLLIYLTTAMGNATIIFLMCVDHRLQTPMYFFISNLAFLEIWFTSSTSIKLFVIPSSGRRMISLSSCFTQSCFYFALGCTEMVLLAVMSFDRYVAICQPLRYAAIMKPELCIHLVAAAWVIGITVLSYRLVLLYKLTFCGSNKIHHFFCDNSPLFTLSCSDPSLLWKTDSVLFSVVILGSLCFTLAFYMGILFCILHLPAAAGRKKAFATCSSHLTTLAIAYGSCIALYVRPSRDVSLETNRIVALLNTVLYPVLNPFIYSLRNKTVILALNEAIARATAQLFPSS
ncbi:olfactory receptor 6E1-like [Theristicus caerulescens]